MFLEPLKRIWLCSNQPCGKRLKMAMPLWLPHYSKQYSPLEPTVYSGLLNMSAATMDRMLCDARVKSKKGLSGTKPGKILKKTHSN